MNFNLSNVLSSRFTQFYFCSPNIKCEMNQTLPDASFAVDIALDMKSVLVGVLSQSTTKDYVRAEH